ncbi:uncharacterized protein LOC141859395 [Acropora palmata]|uniref:uncharacterized protein LOC141859395 n=1 Tax=Acropora palmata TaxID=6131 RepID=UPI003DA0415E
MEPCSKPIVMALSIAQIVMSAAFFLLGMVDRFYVKFAYTSFAFLPCWIFPLVFPVGIMGLALSSHQTVRSSQLLTGESHQPLLAYPVGQQQVRVDVWDNQRSQRRRFSH